ncbi:ABC transporter ATP-binding protein, partial [Alphaproteobacteria bacterium]|nr:ABC transporter ATP-binding protein [Alphaproteobacteria bacterium]
MENKLLNKTPQVQSIILNDVHLSLKSQSGKVNILRGINLNLLQGSAISIVGSSGCGKSTLISVIAGLEKPNKGDVTIQGTNIIPLNENELAKFRKNNLGIIFQSFHLIPSMTALENVALPLELNGIKYSKQIALELLEEVGLKERVKHFPVQLSGGEQQRVALARAFSTKPKLILADEPTGNLDSNTGSNIIDILFRLREKENITLVFAT